MTAEVDFFPVSNGDMTLITLENDQTILIDINARSAADDDNDDTPDVISDLRSRLERDDEGRLFIDTFLLTHPDKDHVTGLENHFHLGKPDTWKEEDDKIFIREMWSSPIVFRRAKDLGDLCSDAEAWKKEAKRRVKCFKDDGLDTDEGDRILILGEDEDGKTDDISGIVIKIDSLIDESNRFDGDVFEARLLGPLPQGDDEDDEEALKKNRSSVILRFSLKAGGIKGKCRFLTGGDAEVAIWERLWNKHKEDNLEWLEYDLLQAPHHLSWRSLSEDSYSDLGEDAKVNDNARNALSQTLKGAVIVASCKPVKKEDQDPPSERAKREYLSMIEDDDDRFFCTDEYWDDEEKAIEFEISSSGVSKKVKKAAAAAASSLGIGGTAAHARPHGQR